MSTPDYYKYDDGETHFECFDISRYYSGDWAQVIQYVFRWQKKGGVENLKKALACANDAYFNGIECKIITNESIIERAVASKIQLLGDTHYAGTALLWQCIADGGYKVNAIKLLERMIENAKKAKSV